MTTPNSSSSPLDIRLFGPFDVRVNGEPLPRLRTRKGQWLLALLALRAGRAVERVWLSGTLWPESDEGKAAANLRQSLTDLRQALGTEARRLESPTVHTLCLNLSGASTDVNAFDAALARGDVASLQTAVALYRGSLLEGCTEDWAFPEREEREQAYLTALETLAAQALASGNAAAEDYLRRVVRTDPLRESAQRDLMTALAKRGDYAAVTQVYRELRLFLRRELNAEPDAATLSLFQRLRDEARQRADRPEKPAPPSLAPQSSSLSLPPSHLPRPLTPLVGREQALAESVETLVGTRLLTLTGAGGVGKTRLAIRIGEEVRNDFAEGVWFIDLAPLTDSTFVPQAVAAVLGVREEPGVPLTDTLTDFLRPRQLLLIPDNCEHLRMACANLAATLLAACPELRILATSRQPLGLTGEIVYRVPSLSLPPASASGSDLVSALSMCEGGRLFVERAAAVMPIFALTERNAPATLQICRRLDGIPLAIELAAARVKVLTAEQIAARLDDRFRLLTTGNPTALPRQQTLRALIDWSYDLLSEPERALLRRLSVFAGGWTLEAAEAICEGVGCRVWGVGENPMQGTGNREQGTEVRDKGQGARGKENPTPYTLHPTPFEVLDLLAQLVDKSLVKAEEDVGGERRYRLLETLRQYGQDRLQEAGEEEALRARHAIYFLRLAERAEPHLAGAQQAEWLNRLALEQDNLRAALAWSAGRVAGLRLSGALWRFWYIRGGLSEGREWMETCLAREIGDGTATEIAQARAKALSGAGVLAIFQGDYALALARHEESLRIRRELDDRSGIAASLTNLGIVANAQGDYVLARAFQEESLAIKRELGDQEGVSIALSNLGLVARNLDDYAWARALYAESLAIDRERKDRWGIAYSLSSLGEVEMAAGDYVAAQALFAQSLAIRRELDDKLGCANTLSTLGAVFYLQGDPAPARPFLEESLTLFRESGEKRGAGYALLYLGLIALKTGETASAKALLEESLAIDREIEHREGIADSLRCLGDIARATGDYATAFARYRESLTVERERDNTPGIARLLQRFARLAAAQGRAEQAGHLFGAGEALQEACRASLSPHERSEYEAGLMAARDALDMETFSTAWAVGRSLTQEQALALMEAPV